MSLRDPELAAQLLTRVEVPGIWAILVQALNARFLQSFQVISCWPERAATGHELITRSRRHDLPTYQVLGHLIGLQAAAAGGDVAGADQHAAAADRLGARQEADLVGVFTTWYHALRTVLTGQDGPAVDAAYERALATLGGCGVPGISRGLEPLTRLCLRLRSGQPLDDLADLDFGPGAPYARPLLAGDADTVRELLRAAPAPPPDHLAELRWALLGEAVRRALAPPRGS